jgi:chemotaxis protein CheZ
MVKPIPQTAPRDSASFDDSGDNEDLQALFDSIAATGNGGGTTVKAVVREVEVDTSGDSDDLQALFDSVSSQVSQPAASLQQASSSSAQIVDPVMSAAAGNEDKDAVAMQVFNRIGHMTRDLHNTMRELGYDKVLEDTARAIPDARQRLTYIAQMTEQAASRVLNATEVVRPIQDNLNTQAKTLAARWDKVFSNQLSPADFKALAADTHGFLHAMPKQIDTTNSQLTEIMMAQDFQDLTGQVIKKVVELAQKMEQQLLSVLVESMPAEVRAEAPEGLLNGPVIASEGRNDIVHTQSQVDDLLESLGF